MQMNRVHVLALSAAAVVTAAAPARAAQQLHNGATESRTAAYQGFVDNTTAETRAWSFFSTRDHTFNTNGGASTITVEALTNTGAPDLTITNSENGGVPRTAVLSGYDWSYGYGGSDLGERNHLANDSGIWSQGGTLTINVPAAVATPGELHHVELLAVAGFTPVRVFSVSANGTPFVTEWNVREGAADHWTALLEFDVAAGAEGISIAVSPGTEPGVDINPFIHALSVTPVPEPSAALLGGLGLLALAVRRRRRRRRRRPRA